MGNSLPVIHEHLQAHVSISRGQSLPVTQAELLINIFVTAEL